MPHQYKAPRHDHKPSESQPSRGPLKLVECARRKWQRDANDPNCAVPSLTALYVLPDRLAHGQAALVSATVQRRRIPSRLQRAWPQRAASHSLLPPVRGPELRASRPLGAGPRPALTARPSRGDFAQPAIRAVHAAAAQFRSAAAPRKWAVRLLRPKVSRGAACKLMHVRVSALWIPGPAPGRGSMAPSIPFVVPLK